MTAFQFTHDGGRFHGQIQRKVKTQYGPAFCVEGIAQDAGLHFMVVNGEGRRFDTARERDAYAAELAMDAEKDLGYTKEFLNKRDADAQAQHLAVTRGKKYTVKQGGSGFLVVEEGAKDAEPQGKKDEWPWYFHDKPDDKEHTEKRKEFWADHWKKNPNAAELYNEDAPSKEDLKAFHDFEHGYKVKPGEEKDPDEGKETSFHDFEHGYKLKGRDR